MNDNVKNFRLFKLFLLSTLSFSVFFAGCETKGDESVPVVGSVTLSAITESSVECNSSIVSDGGSMVEFRGFCWSVDDHPTINDNVLTDSSGLGDFNQTITKLMTGATYFVRAFATNRFGTSYSEPISFTTKSCLLTTTTPYFILANSAISGGYLLADFDSTSVLARGVCWNTFPNPTIADSITKDGLGKGGFTSTMIGLNPSTTYYVRAYATTSAGTTYGSEYNFTTQSGVVAVTTEAVKDITATSATFTGIISGDGGAEVSEYGFVWGTSTHPTTSDHKECSQAANGVFSSLITGMKANTSYYVRAYAINTAGTSYGNEHRFDTQTGVINLTTSAVSDVKPTSANIGGNVISDGGAFVLSRGLCWSEEPSPTVGMATKSDDGVGLGSFSRILSDLEPGKQYYARAYATNSIGTFYGQEVAFSTPNAIISLITSEATLVSATTATLGCVINSVGGVAVDLRGFCWSENPNPTIVESKLTIANSANAYSGKVTGLKVATKYYVRAFATNVFGTFYGNEISFTTFPASGTMSDADGNEYHYITIGSQSWTVENLRTTKYADGSPIALVADSAQWVNLSTGAYCEYTNFNNLPSAYGRLYNWYAVNDSRKIAPVGWHVPTSADWNALFAFLGGSSVAGAKLKEAGTSHWNNPNVGATNSSGFTLLPTGYRHNGSYYLIGSTAFSWVSTESTSTTAGSMEFGFWTSEVIKMDRSKRTGISVRCVRDN